MTLHGTLLLLARRPVANKLREMFRGYLLQTMGKYRSPAQILRERMPTKIRKFTAPQVIVSRIHDFRMKWQNRGHASDIGTPVRWAHTASLLHRIAPLRSGNEIRVYDDTGVAFEKMWEAIDAAKVNIRWATYICKDDAVGQETIQRLVQAAQRGVFVQFLYDDGGNIGGRDSLVQPLRNERNAQVLCFNPVFAKMLRYIMSLRWHLSPGIRNHRKILLVDDSVAFVGGLNIGNEYAGTICGGSGKFRDTMCEVSGPIVADILESFNETMYSSEKSLKPKTSRLSVQRERIQKFMRMPRKQILCKLNEIRNRRRLRREWSLELQQKNSHSGKIAQILTSNAWKGNYAIQKAYHIVLNRSRHRVWITTPYFLPTGRLLRAVLRAAKRGVDVRILTGSIRTTDPFLMWWGSQYIVHKLLKCNVKLFEFEGKRTDENGTMHRIMHAKTLVVDGVWCSVGSYNLDALSNKLLEISVSSIDYALASEMEKQFLCDLKQSKQISNDAFNSRSVWQKILIAIIYRIGRVIEKVSFWSFSHREVETSFDENDA